MAECRIAATYRNPFEQKIADQLEQAGVAFDYEPTSLPVTIPARVAKYKPDFIPKNSNIIIEGKGAFGGGHSNYNASSAAARQKMLLVKEQYPDRDIRFVFSNANSKIYKGSSTTYAKWADDHGFAWSDKGKVPRQWIEEILRQQKKGSGSTSAKTKVAVGSGKRARCLTATAASAKAGAVKGA
jgi:hypothetical protein